MSRTSSTYVSPNLAPTSDWAQQTSTGVFRPPPASSSWHSYGAGSSTASGDKHADPKQIYLLPASTAQKANEHVAGGSVEGTPHLGARSAPRGSYTGISPSLGPEGRGAAAAQPFYPIPASPHDSVLVLMKMIRQAVHAEQDVFRAQKECNRTLEAEISREQEQRKATADSLAAVVRDIAHLKQLADEQEAVIIAIKAAMGSAN